MIPLKEFLDAPTSIYSRKWAIRPWWLISWGLKQLGFFEKQAALGRLPTARYVIIPNVEVGSVLEFLEGLSDGGLGGWGPSHGTYGRSDEPCRSDIL